MKINLKENTPQLIATIVVLVVVLVIAIIFSITKTRQISHMEELYAIEKQQLEDEYEAIALQYEGFKFSVRNDSLLAKLESEQAKVQRLQEELKLTKATDQKEIQRLKKELETLRKILKTYIIQIDSLNRLNQELKNENIQIKQQYQETSRTLTQIAKEREELSHKVSLASKLDAININVKAVNDRGKEQKRLSRSTRFVISFTIAKNITAEPGERIIYVRIMTPDGNVLTKNPTDTFPFENGQLQYSIKRIIEYGGEETPVTVYWNIEEFLMPGTYKVDIFADGNHIGSYSFTMQE
jgi:predicted  nucleic acid-binding Zn-ribbon protein